MNEWSCAECGTANDGAAPRCLVCDGRGPGAVQQHTVPRATVEFGPAAVRRPPAGPWTAIAAGLAIVAGLVGGGYLILDGEPGPLAAAETPVDGVPVPEQPVAPATRSAQIQQDDRSPKTAWTPEPMPEWSVAEETPLPGPGAVGLVSITSEAAADHRASRIAALFDIYFTGINAHDATVASRVFAPGGVVDPVDPDQVAAFGKDIATTQDLDVRLLGIADDAHAGEVIATVSFTSTQAPGYGPPERRDETCTAWRLDFRLTSWEGNLLIFGTAPGAVSAPCA